MGVELGCMPIIAEMRLALLNFAHSRVVCHSMLRRFHSHIAVEHIVFNVIDYIHDDDSKRTSATVSVVAQASITAGTSHGGGGGSISISEIYIS